MFFPLVWPLNTLYSAVHAMMSSSPPPLPEHSAACDLLAAADDPAPDNLWVWEVRDLKRALPGAAKAAVRKLAEAYRKRRKDVRRLLLYD